jgi:hypothetical protein
MVEKSCSTGSSRGSGGKETEKMSVSARVSREKTLQGHAAGDLLSLTCILMFHHLLVTPPALGQVFNI